MKKQTIIFFLFLFLGLGSYAQHVQQKPTVYMVADAHLDTQWNWDIQTTIKEYVWNTLSQNLFLLKQYPNYVFNFEGGVKYAWMKEYYPTLYEELKYFIKNGRWHISGASWDATDTLVPSVESAIRNILLGQNFYRSEFGVESTDIFLPDCFGFGWTLPTVAAHCGLIGFSSQKLQWRNSPFYGNEKYPFTIGLWKGIDGSNIMMAHGYDYNQRWEDQDLSQSSTLLDLTTRSPLNMAYRYYGTGDIGGSPTLESVRAVEKGVKGNGDVKIVSSTSDRLYKDFQPYTSHPELPVFDGELLMDVHGTGCYTSQAAMKLYNRQNELLGDAAERSSVIADWLKQASYPKDVLTENWKRFIFHQFHDDLTGTSIPRAYEFSWNDELIALKQFSGVITSSVGSVANMMDTKVKGIPVVIYNALGFQTTNVVEVNLEFAHLPKGITVYNENGAKVPSQLLSYADGKAKILLEATVPATGFVVYDIRITGTEKLQEVVKTNILENSIYKITVNEYGDIISLFDKKNNKELVRAGEAIRLALFTQNKSYEWPAWEILKGTIDAAPISITDNVRITQIEDGQLRKSLCIEKQYNGSIFKQYIRLYEGELAERIDFYNEVDWKQTNALLKAEFPLNVENTEATYDLGLGSISRGNNTKTAYEVYAQYWADLTDRGNDYGISIMNDSKYGWDKPNDHTLRLTLLHTPETDKSYVYQNRQDFGYHSFTYSLIGHAGKLNKVAITEKAETFNQQLKVFRADKHKGVLGKKFSFVSCNNPNVVIKALKKAENSDEYVVRVYEVGGIDKQKATLSFIGEISSAYEADGSEKEIGSADFKLADLYVDIEPYSIKTFKIKLKSSNFEQPINSSHQSLKLPYNHKCSSFNEFRWEADFESGYSYAAELFPDSLTVNQIPFEFGEKDSFNGLLCDGDTIQLSAEKNYNRLYFLAAATDKDSELLLQCGNKQEAFFVPSYTGFIGQWGHLGHTEGYLKDAEIAYVGTHRHSALGDEPYELTYMFKYGMDIPKDAKYIILPKNENVVVFAITLGLENQKSVQAVSTLFNSAIREKLIAQGKIEKTKGENVLKNAKIIACSGYFNEREKADYMIDGDLNTKWCEVGNALSYVDFDLKGPKSIKMWKLVNAGRENKDYITSACFLQGRNSLSEEWKTLDYVDGNRKNIIFRTLNNPVEVRYIRLMVTRPTQRISDRVLRICEMELY